VPDALDDAELLERFDAAIADGGRLLAELGRLRAAVAARIPAEPEILAAADDDDDNFRPHLMLWPSEAAQRFWPRSRYGQVPVPDRRPRPEARPSVVGTRSGRDSQNRNW
jgi:hypothetical protein